MADIVPSAPRGLLEAIPGLKQVGLLAGVAAAIAAAIWLVLWSQGQNYSVLYGQLSERESGQVMDALTAAGIEYKLSPSGAVSVPESKVQEARIRLASQGLPQSDSMGIEMIQKESALGTSSMMESARYQSVLETELARTIVKVQGVQSARVHLALPKPSVFLRDAHKATASVMLQLYPGRRLEPGQVAAIVHLVASSVPELAASDVTLVDQAGSLAQFAGRDRGGRRQHPPARIHAQIGGELSAAHHRAARAHGRRRPRAGDRHRRPRLHRHRGDARELRPAEDGRAQRTNRQRDAQGRRRRRRHTRRAQQSTTGNFRCTRARGRSAHARYAAARPAAAGTGPSSSSQRSTRNFEVDRILSYVKQPVGNLKRLSVGVVLDDWQKVDADGKVTTAPMSDSDVKRFSQLIRESIGLKEDRGDQLNVLNQAFKGNGPIAPVEGPPIWEAPWVTQLAKQIVGAGLVLLVAFLVLRPLMKSLTKSSSRLSSAGAGDFSDDRVSISGQGGKPIKLAPSFEQQIAAARTLVGQDPKRAAQVVKDWVAADG